MINLKEQIRAELEELSLDRLPLVVEYIRLLKQTQEQPGFLGWKKYVGVLTDEEAKELRQIMDEEFGKTF